MKILIRLIPWMIILFNLLFPDYCADIDDSEWCYSSTSFQGFYMFESITVNGEDVEETDLLGAFINDVCIGYSYTYPMGDGGQGGGFSTLPLMGNDGGFWNYISVGEIPTVIFYDSSEGTFLGLNISSTYVDINYNQEYDEGELQGEYPGWENNQIFIILGAATAESFIEGDINIDFDVNIVDVVTGVYIILDIISAYNFQLQQIDYNQDGQDDILDMLSIVNYILSE